MNLHVWNRLATGDGVMVHRTGSPLTQARRATVVSTRRSAGRSNVVTVRLDHDGQLAWPDRDTVHVPIADPACWRCVASGATRHRPAEPSPS